LNLIDHHHHPVLIVGAGPIGLALAAYLGSNSIKTILIEKNEDVLGSAKMIVVSMRTMEFCRSLGFSDEVRHWGFPLDHGLDSIFVTGLQGFELGRVKAPSLLTEFDTPFSPERERPCPQTWFDPILQKKARSHPSIDLQYKSTLSSFNQFEDYVDCEILRSDGEVETIRSSYLVGCDGYSSSVREKLGIELEGNKHLDFSMSVYLTIPDLLKSHSIGDAYRYIFVDETGVWSVLTTIDGHNLYRLQLIGANEVDVLKFDIDVVIKRCIGSSLPYEIKDISRWVRKSTCAQKFSSGRVFIAGDSAHAHPPNGGLGMNTGILDAWDLGWKLSAKIQGWGGNHLLESYDLERRPASFKATQESLKNYHRLVGKPSYIGIDEPGTEGEIKRRALGEKLVADNEKAWRAVGIHIGHVYSPSPIVIEDGQFQSDGDEDYVPSSRPGARAPHVWLSSDESILDLFGFWFTLLNFSDINADEFLLIAKKLKMPFKIELILNQEAKSMYEKNLVLVRPDGHVCWRSNEMPIDIEQLLNRVRGF